MFRNYFKIAYRNLLRNKVTTFINIGGLTFGMAVALLIGLWVRDELTFNEYHKNHDRIAQTMQHRLVDGNKETLLGIPVPLEEHLRSKYGSDFKHLAIAFWPQEQVLSSGQKKFTKLGNYMGKDVIPLFSLNMLSGSNDALSEPGSILLSESTAKIFFGEEEALGKLMKINNDMEAVVTGVYEDLPKNSSLHNLAFIAPWELYVSSQNWLREAQEQSNWDMNVCQLFIQLADHSNLKDVNEKIRRITYDHAGEFEKAYDQELFLNPMEDWHLRSNWKNGAKAGGLIQYVWLFGIIGVFVLILACINFMNLSTAQSERRSKEVGIRKSIGSLRSQLIHQFLMESFLIVLLSFVLSIAIVLLVLPFFNELAGKAIVLPIASLSFWLTSFGFIILTGLLAGSYPALYLSSFRPVQVLKGTHKSGKSTITLRKGLVILQFTVSVALIIGSVTVRQQIQYTKDRPMGYDVNNTIMVWSNSPDFKGKFDLLRSELKSKQAIQEMSESSSPLTNVFSHHANFNWPGKDPNLQVNFATIRVTHEYGKTIGWKITDGRDFSRDYASDSMAFILNKTAVEYMKLEDPLDQVIVWGEGESANKFHIVGVIEDIVMESPFQAVKPTIYSIGSIGMDCMTLKLNPNKSTQASLALVKEVFSKHLPAMPFDYRFVDREHELKFAAEERIGILSSIFAVLAIFISCLGLFGLVSFVVEQRTKEIGIRKVLGASVFNIWKMMSADFVRLVFFSCLLAIPIAFYLLNNWLQNFEYKTVLPWWAFAYAGFGAIFIALLTVSFHTIKTAIANPVKSLKAE